MKIATNRQRFAARTVSISVYGRDYFNHCGHEHRSIRAAEKCAHKLDRADELARFDNSNYQQGRGFNETYSFEI